MLQLNKLHHIAIICSDYPKSKKFYTEIMGFEIIKEVYREERDSWKLDLSFNGEYLIELFSFPDNPPRVSWPEARGLRHIAFEVDSIEESVSFLKEKKIKVGDIMVDPYTDKKFCFFDDPDELPIELYEM